MCEFRNVWVCVCVSSVMCGCVYEWVLKCVGVFDNCVGVLVNAYLYLLCF